MKDRKYNRFAHRVYNIFLGMVSIIGILLTITSLITVFQSGLPFNLILLMFLAALSAIVLAVRPVGEAGRYAYDVGSGLSIALLPLYGLSGSVLVSAIITISSWLLNQRSWGGWRKTAPQLAFNIGMLTIASSGAYLAYNAIGRTPFPTERAEIVFGWLAAAIVYELVNRLLVAIMIKIRQQDVILKNALMPDGWSDALLTMVVNFVGAALVGYALLNFDWRGIVIFFIPVLISSLAYLIHVRNAAQYMEQLEAMVQARTLELEKANLELEKANHDKDMFLRIVTHDMKTPLFIMRNYIQALRKDPSSALSKPRILENLHSAETGLSRLVSDLADVENWSKGVGLAMKSSDVELNDVLGQVVDLISADAATRKLQMRFVPANDDMVMLADPHHIERIFTNLISNAVKYTPSGGTITASIKPSTGCAIVTIEDTGYGIPANEIDHIFKEFYRVVDHEDVAMGSGIGLSIVKRLVEAHDGTINVYSVVGEGSIFTLEFPLIEHELNVSKHE